MMPVLAFLSRLARDRRGGTLVEFALLAPVLLTLLIGVLQVGMHVQNTNAVRNLASDGARAAVVEYQRGNSLTASQIAADIQARGVGPKYNLMLERLEVEVEEQSPSQIAGVTEMRIDVTYRMPNFLAFVDLSALDLEYSRPVFLLPPPPPEPEPEA